MTELRADSLRQRSAAPRRRIGPWLWLVVAILLTGSNITGPHHARAGAESAWPPGVVQPLPVSSTGLSGRPLQAAADGADGLWIAGRGELARWSPAGVSELHIASQTAWMVDDRVQHLLAVGDLIWFGTPAGLGRLGAGAPAWFGPGSGLPDPRVSALAGPTADGDLLVGTWRGTVALAPDGQFAAPGDAPQSRPATLIASGATGPVPPVPVSPGQIPACGSIAHPAAGPAFVTAVVSDLQGVMWAGDSDSLWVCPDRQWRSVAALAGGALAMTLDGRGRVWVGTGTGLWRLAGETLVAAPGPGGPTAVLWPQADGVIAGTVGHGLWRCPTDGCEPIPGVPANAQLRGLAHDGRHLWAATDAGLYRCSDRCAPFQHADLPAAGTLGPLTASAGALWAGAPRGGGLVRIDSSGQIQRYSLDRRLPEGDIAGLLPLARHIWLATESGLIRYGSDGFVPMSQTQALAVGTDAQGQIWVGDLDGLRPVASGPVADSNAAITLPSGGAVRSMHLDARGHLWAGGPDGLAEFDAGLGATDHTAQLSNPSVRAISSDGAGRVWVATSGGLARWQDDTWKAFHKADGLPSDVVWAVHADMRGGLWVGTFGAGAARFDGDSFHALTSAHGLPSNVVRQILSDGAGNVWFVTDVGLAMIGLQDLPDLRNHLSAWVWVSLTLLVALLSFGAAGFVFLRHRRR